MSSIHTIIVNYNSGDWLNRCLRSVLSFTTGSITVVDNASTDLSINTAQNEFAAESRLQWLLNQQNLGFAAANNQVLSKLNTEFALLLNPDCEMNKDTLNLMLQAFKQQPKLGLASCLIYNEDGSVQATCRRRFPTPWTALVRILQLHRLFPENPKFANFDYGELSLNESNSELVVENIEAISGAFMMVRCQALSDVGLLDDDYFMHCEDLDWCKRFEQSDWNVGFVSAASVMHAKGVSSLSRPIKVLWNLHQGMNRFFNKHYYHDYPWWLRTLVKLGIVASFLVRSVVNVIKRLVPA